MSSFTDFAQTYLTRLGNALQMVDLPTVERARQLMIETSRAGGTIWLIGNGGSATLASHMATDLQLAGLRAISLTDIAAVTTYGNDFGYENSFVAQVKRLVQRGDLIVAISGSGSSANILNACFTADDVGAKIITITGFSGGRMVADLDGALHLRVDVGHMGIAQDVHQVILHLICYSIMEKPSA